MLLYDVLQAIVFQNSVTLYCRIKVPLDGSGNEKRVLFEMFLSLRTFIYHSKALIAHNKMATTAEKPTGFFELTCQKSTSCGT